MSRRRLGAWIVPLPPARNAAPSWQTLRSICAVAWFIFLLCVAWWAASYVQGT